jgi:hypothetical protein
MSVAVLSWWALLCLVGVLNLAVWAVSAAALKRRRPSMPGEEYSARRLQLLLCAGYVSGCAFRSFLPVYDVPRITLVDSWISTAMVGRSVATIAELCFACQWAFLLRETARATGSLFAHSVTRMVVPMLAIAEACSWYSVLTTSNLGHVLEESLWGLCAALVVACMVMIRPRCSPIPRSAVIAWCVAGVAYVAYMFLVDVPMYWSRWLADQAAGKSYFTLVKGVLDASHRRVVTYSLEHWRSEMLWMGLYFSVAVWISLSLIHIPATDARTVEGRGRRKSQTLIPGIRAAATRWF